MKNNASLFVFFLPLFLIPLEENTMGKTIETLQGIRTHMQNVGKETPEFMGAFQQFMQAAKKPGALSTKTKELIGVALSVKNQCHRCIPFHVKSAIDQGVTRLEILEAAEQALLFGGGPALMYLEEVIQALDDLGV